MCKEAERILTGISKYIDIFSSSSMKIKLNVCLILNSNLWVETGNVDTDQIGKIAPFVTRARF